MTGTVLIRLRDLSKDGYRNLKNLCSDPELPKENARFLTEVAIRTERPGISNTYLLTDGDLMHILGHFTLSAGVHCAYDRPAFEVSGLYGKDRRTESALIQCASDIVRGFSEKICPATLTARCKEKQLWTFVDAGYSYVGTVPGGQIRMRYGGFGGTEVSQEPLSPLNFPGSTLC